MKSLIILSLSLSAARLAAVLPMTANYLFVGRVKPKGDKQQIHVLKRAACSHAGIFVPGPEVGGNAGWQDMPSVMEAFEWKPHLPAG